MYQRSHVAISSRPLHIPPLHPPFVHPLLSRLTFLQVKLQQLVVPSTPIFPLTQPIPFHVQLSSLSPHLLSSLTTSTITSIRVSLERQISIYVHKQKVLQTISLGEGSLKRIDWDALDEDLRGGPAQGVEAWEGTVLAGSTERGKMLTGGFKADGLHVKVYPPTVLRKTITLTRRIRIS
jgi:hypothetical protein